MQRQTPGRNTFASGFAGNSACQFVWGWRPPKPWPRSATTGPKRDGLRKASVSGEIWIPSNGANGSTRPPVGDLWGVGRRLAARLEAHGVQSAGDLARTDSRWLRQHYGVVLARTQQELRGVPCLSLEEVSPPSQQIQCSRSFGRSVTEFSDVLESLSLHTQRGIEKLHEQALWAGSVQVTVRSSPFCEGFYSGTAHRRLPEPSRDYRVLWEAVRSAAAEAFQSGVSYQKSGILLFDLQVQARTGDLFAVQEGGEEWAERLQEALQRAQERFGKHTLARGVGGLRQGRDWAMRSDRRSPSYLSDWWSLPVAFAR